MRLEWWLGGTRYVHNLLGVAMIIKLLVVVGAFAVGQAPTAPMCTLRAEDGRLVGSCGALIEGEETSLSITPAAAITSGVWKRGSTPTGVWEGTVVVGEYPATPIEIELYGDEVGAMRTLFGWFPVSQVASAEGSLRLAIDPAHEVLPSDVDRDIVQRAMELLSSEAVWNRADNRNCPPNATTWSIYCAMVRATIDVAGAFHHRRPALQVVRAIVDDRTVDRPYDHRLMDYNNDPTTRLGDVWSLLHEALGRISPGMPR